MYGTGHAVYGIMYGIDFFFCGTPAKGLKKGRFGHFEANAFQFCDPFNDF